MKEKMPMNDEKILHPDQEEPVDQTYGWKYHRYLLLIAIVLTFIFYLVVYNLAQI
ncbi:hypothetical protein HS125_16045 [bacterium]|nr:hypothetical protein [bacterium]